MLHLGPVALGETPRIVACLRDQTLPDRFQALRDAGVDIIEFRIDQFRAVEAGYVLGELAHAAGWPILATIRSPVEGGAWRGAEAARLALFKSVVSVAHAVDIELVSKDILPGVVAAARSLGRVVVMSHHDFNHTPSLETLHALHHSAREAGGDIFKIAAQCQSPHDLRTLARFTLEAEDKPVVVIGMGTEGAISRIFFPALGSLFTYTSLDVETGPGQIRYDETAAWFGRFYPNYNRKREN